ncbi:LamG domain-containing protein [Aquiflexum lacus]|uniref:LamG domain-containing protein n=1 Tax=Aquiflexum lacus TaxID=2483805 RepID=UPI001895FC17|nr:LamG domain-containing protein [Aquiflexum lacus]
MKSTIKFILFYACFFISIFSGVAQSTPQGFTLVAYEGFDYSSGSPLRNAAGGTGWTNPWVKAYQDRFLKTATTGFTYSGLTTTGLRAEFDNTCYGTCNDIAALRRSLPLQNNGVVYFQFISVFEANGGFGTPNIRLFSEGTLTGGVGASSGSFMSILDATLSNTASSTASLSAQNLVVVRIDYNLNKTEMWINPDLSTFDYSNPISPSATASGFSPSFDRMDIFIRSGSIDEISVFAAISAPTSISGNNTICAGDNTTLSASGGTTGSNVIDVWHSGPFDEAFSEGWDTQPYTTLQSTINSTNNGILNVTSTGGDPQINMYNLGSFDPSVYKYINFRYRVVSGSAGAAQIFFTNSAITVATVGYSVTKSLISDNTWRIATIDMSAHASWTDSNITGWRFDYSNNSGVTMDIDFIQLGTSPIVGTGTSLSVAPTVSTTYSVNRKGPSVNTMAISQLVTVSPLPIPTFTTQPDDIVIDSDVTYTSQSGQSNYVWTIPGILNTDYSISSGGTSTDNFVVLKWLNFGSRAIQINYTNSNNCVGATATSSSSIKVRNYGITKNGLKISNPVISINQNGAIGTGKSLSIYGENMNTPYSWITSGLIMHLDASNTSSYPGTGTTWSDLSGNANHGTLINGVTYTSANNGALIFDGVNDYFVTNNNLDLSSTDKITIQIILKPATTSEKMIMEHSIDWNSNNSYGVFVNNNKMQFTDHNQGYNVRNSVATINDNNWHLLSATTDRSLNATNQTVIYIDGNAPNSEIVPTLASDNNGNFASHKLYISSRAGTGYYFSGTIAQVLIYNRVLTAEEILKNYNALKSTYGL